MLANSNKSLVNIVSSNLAASLTIVEVKQASFCLGCKNATLDLQGHMEMTQ